MAQICAKRVLLVRTRKIGYCHRMQDTQIRLDTKFQLKEAILIFWTKFSQKQYFRSKTGKLKILLKFSTFKNDYVPNFVLNKQFCFFGSNFPRRGTKIAQCDILG